METVKGINRILLFRVLSKSGTQSASKLAFQTEHEVTKTRDLESTPTKDGYVKSLAESETEISVTSILAQGDAFATEIEQAYDDGEIIEMWDINRTGEAVSGKYPSTYYQAYMTEFSQAPNAEDDVELSMSFGVNGKGQKGEATLTADQEAFVQYAFADTTTAP